MRRLVNHYDTYKILWEQGQEMLQFLDKNIDQNASPTDSLFQHYDHDIAVSSGGNASPMGDFARGVVTIQNGRYSKYPRGSRFPSLSYI